MCEKAGMLKRPVRAVSLVKHESLSFTMRGSGNVLVCDTIHPR